VRKVSSRNLEYRSSSNGLASSMKSKHIISVYLKSVHKSSDWKRESAAGSTSEKGQTPTQKY
jgi:hypothetical protein